MRRPTRPPQMTNPEMTNPETTNPETGLPTSRLTATMVSLTTTATVSLITKMGSLTTTMGSLTTATAIRLGTGQPVPPLRIAQIFRDPHMYSAQHPALIPGCQTADRQEVLTIDCVKICGI